MFSLLGLALWLGVLSFYLGLLLYALPIPSLSLKRWGRTLAQDGLFIVFLVSAFKFLVYLGDAILQHFGLIKEEVLETLKNAYMNSILMYSGINALKEVWKTFVTPFLKSLPGGSILTILNKIMGGTLAYLFNNVIVAAAVTDTLSRFYLIASSLWLLLYTLYTFVNIYFQFIVALGVFFMAVPFRLMRPAGASLIGFAYSIYVVLPLVLLVNKIMLSYLPEDMSWFLKSITPFNEYLTKISDKGVTYTSGYVRDYNDKGVPYAIVAFCDLRYQCGYYVTNEQGFFDANYPFGGVPWPVSIVRIYILGVKAFSKIMDWRFYAQTPDKMDQILFKLNNVYMSHEGFYLIVNGLIRLDEEPRLLVDPYGTVYYTVAFTIRKDNTTVDIVTTGVIDPSTIRFEVLRKGELEESEAKSYIWGGVEVWDLRIRGNAGAYVKIKITGKHTYFVPPNVGNLGYLEVVTAKQLSVAAITTNVEDVTLLFPFVVSVLPFIDLMIVSLGAYGIASALSGGVRSLVRRVW